MSKGTELYFSLNHICPSNFKWQRCAFSDLLNPIPQKSRVRWVLQMKKRRLHYTSNLLCLRRNLGSVGGMRQQSFKKPLAHWYCDELECCLDRIGESNWCIIDNWKEKGQHQSQRLTFTSHIIRCMYVSKRTTRKFAKTSRSNGCCWHEKHFLF